MFPHLYTVAQGQRVAIWSPTGERTLVDGPRRLFLFRERVVPLKAHVADPMQYLVVQHADGRTVHHAGPVTVFQDPVDHLAISTAPAIPLDANEALVVYKREFGNAGGVEKDAVTRRIVRGPTMFVPTATEWVHEFVWHGSDPGKPTKKVPGALRFTKLRVIPDQTYLDVDEVRTADDALLTVRLMIFFELRDIGTMLNETHDPVADFINAATADVIRFAAGLTFEELKTNAGALNELGTYGALTNRAERIGYTVSKVVYRGYSASAKLQAMHDNAIETRTKLRLDSENEAQAQDLADLKLGREGARARQMQEMETAQAEHRLALAERRHAQRVAHRRARGLARQEERQALFAEMARHGVDLTRYLVARHERVDRVIRMEGSRAGRVHLHERV